MERLFAIFSNPEVTRFWSRPAYTTRAQALALVEDIHACFRAGHLHPWGVARLEDDLLIGTCTLAGIDRVDRRAEVGSALA